jgi:thiol-disulfide isomerase/thioredoxin
MKNLVVFTLLIFSLMGCSKQHTNQTFVDSNGNKIIFSALQGKWVFINYWATWCHPCMAEIPQLNQFYLTHKDRVVVLGVNYDALDSTALNDAIQKLKINFPVLTKDPAKTLSLDDTGVVPTTYVFNPNGSLVKTLLGPQTKNNLDKIIRN